MTNNPLKYYSLHEINEIKRCADPGYFISNYIKVNNPTHGPVKFSFNQGKSLLLDHIHKNQFSIALCCRQSGKTTLAASYLLWQMLFQPYTSVVSAHVRAIHGYNFIEQVLFFYRSLPEFLQVRLYESNKSRLTFENGSSISTVPCSSILTGMRGRSVNTFFIEELAFFDTPFTKEDWRCIFPVLHSTNAKVFIISTPYTTDDEFGKLWKESKDSANGFVTLSLDYKHFFNDEEISRIINHVGQARFASEYKCEFLNGQ